LWTAGVRAARERGHVVLASRPAEAETQLSFAALCDLLATVADDVLTELPLPQRRALEVALLLSEPEDAPPDQRAVAAGLLSALRVLSGRGPVVIAINDVQWLDAASASLLEFALRRVRADPIRVLLSWRSAGGQPLPLGLGHALRGPAVRRVEVGPLSLGAIHDVVLGRFGRAFARPFLRRAPHPRRARRVHHGFREREVHLPRPLRARFCRTDRALRPRRRRLRVRDDQPGQFLCAGLLDPRTGEVPLLRDRITMEGPAL
jgi:AAA ATPase domain